MQAAIDQNRMSRRVHSWLNNRLAVYWGVALGSVLLSFYRIAGKDLINGDGILYIRIAQAFSTRVPVLLSGSTTGHSTRS